jgi:hypothetical protein
MHFSSHECFAHLDRALYKSTMRHDRQAIAALMEKLATVPPARREQISTMEAVAEMAPRVRELREKGYSWDEVREMFAREGFEVSRATLVTYFKKVAGSGKRTRRQRRSATSRRPVEPTAESAPDRLSVERKRAGFGVPGTGLDDL